jgi:hypothetical protein
MRVEAGIDTGMRVWKKKVDEKGTRAGVARAALAGASRDELLRAALQALTKEGHADRIGVWTEAEASPSHPSAVPAALHGLVWDRENPESPREWMNLSVEPPLPEELLLGGKTVEQDLEAFPERPLIGQLLGLRRALRIPVISKDHLRGIILAGSKGRQVALSRDRAEALAAELALALELAEQRKILCSRNADLATARRFVGTQAAGHSVETLL